MVISLIDRSNYLRGLLILIRMDRKISEPEKEIMMRIGKVLDFNEEFCANAIQKILQNEHIADEPPLFESRELAKMFVLDGLTLGLCDHDALHTREEEWLRSAVTKNKLEAAWFENQLGRAVKNRGSDLDLEAYHLEVD